MQLLDKSTEEKESLTKVSELKQQSSMFVEAETENMEPQMKDVLKSTEINLVFSKIPSKMKFHEIKQRKPFRERTVLESFKLRLPKFTWCWEQVMFPEPEWNARIENMVLSRDLRTGTTYCY
jgi:hypothetical protein